MDLKRKLLDVCLFGALGMVVPALGQEQIVASSSSIETEARNLDRTVATQGEARVQQRIAGDFADWAGSTQNATALVSGLREGKTIVLSNATQAVTGTTVASPSSGFSFTPPTRPMGYGNVYIALALAKAQLAQQGINSPSPQQLQAALNGGTVISGNPPEATEFKGVLQLRSEGMGWGRVAQTYDIKLGPVMAGMKSAHQSLATTARVTTTTRTPVSGSGVIRADNTSIAQGNATSRGRGIVTANDHAAANTALGAAGARGIVSAGGGNGNGQGFSARQAKGHSK